MRPTPLSAPGRARQDRLCRLPHQAAKRRQTVDGLRNMSCRQRRAMPGASERSASSVTTRPASDAADKLKDCTNVREIRTGYWHMSQAIVSRTLAHWRWPYFSRRPQRQFSATQFDHLTTGYELQGAIGICPANTVTRRVCSRARRAIAWGVTPWARESAPRRGRQTTSRRRTTASCVTRSILRSHCPHGSPGRARSCFSCHNGVSAMGKNPGHVPSDNSCGACHTTKRVQPGPDGTRQSRHPGREFLPHLSFGRAGGHFASQSPANHQECGACHGTLSWSPARFNHTGISGNCQSCHNGAAATGKVAIHETSRGLLHVPRYPNWSR